jgi:C1A family cysteine protease
MSKHQFGWIPDRPDQRDLMFSAVYKPIPKLPTSVDLQATFSAVEDQGSLGSCTANALVGALEFLENKDQVPFTDLSRLFIYYNERVIEHTVGSDSGAMLRDGIKTLAKQGVCSEKKWPYVISKFKSKPTKACYTDAAQHLITSYQRVRTLDDMRSCLAAGYPFVFGFTVYESFESSQVAKTGVVPMPAKGESVLGGHAVVAVGYNDSKKVFTVRNSWGTNWGQKGYFTIPYNYLTNSNLAGDMWTIRRQQGMIASSTQPGVMHAH